MAITVVNGTHAQDVEFSIAGVVDGSAQPPMWSGTLAPMYTSGWQIQMAVSGYDLYSVSFYTVGYNGNDLAAALSQPVPDESMVSLSINVFPN